MAKTVTKTFVYRTYAELQAELGKDHPATEKARETLRGWAVEDNWYESDIDSWQDLLAEIGYEDAKIAFSGFSSQGDGASFTANVDVVKLAHYLSGGPTSCPALEEAQPHADRRYAWLAACPEVADCVTLKITRSGRYCHEMTMSYDMTSYCGRRETLESVLDELGRDALQTGRRLAKRIYSDLEAQYNWLQSDEAIEEDAEANGYLFDEEGNKE